MAKALKCDRCGKLYEHYEGIRVQDKGVHYVSLTLNSGEGWGRNYDLCPECMTKLVEFIKNKEEDAERRSKQWLTRRLFHVEQSRK